MFRLLKAAGLLLPLVAAAVPSDPLNPRAEVPPQRHDSALRSRQPDRPPDTPTAWREAHERVLRAGGWRAYAREPLPQDKAPTP